MALKAVLETLDDLPEELKPVAEVLYAPRDGKYALQLEGLDDGGALRRALEHERKQRADAVRQRQDLEARLREIEEGARRPPDGGAADAAPNKEIERLNREYNERLKGIEAKLSAAEEQRKAAEHKLSETRISDLLRAAALEAGVPKESVEDLISLPKFRSPWKMQETGEPAPFDGDLPRFDPQSLGQTMTPKAYVSEYLQQNRHWLPAPTGGGAAGSTGPRANGGVISVTRAQLKDPAMYQKVKEQSAKTGATINVTE